MNRNSKKGFTIVELIIVIAVIAVLAAVLIPTFSNLIQKANEAADQTLIKNLNTALKMDTTVSKHETMSQALNATKANGFDVEKIVARATDNKIVWDSVNDCFAYIEKDKSEPTYIPDTKTDARVAEYQLWAIVNGAKLDEKYSSYLAGTEITGTINATNGVDVGGNTGIALVKYTGGAAKRGVIIRTNSGETKIEINASNDTVYHYGAADEVKVLAVDKSNSYHELGSVKTLEVTSGHIVLESGSLVYELKKATDAKDIDISFENKGTVIKNTANVEGVIQATSFDIYTLEQLCAFRDYVNAGMDFSNLPVEIKDDIDMSKISWYPIGTGEHPFNGVIRGNNHTLKGLTNGTIMSTKDVFTTTTTKTYGSAYGFIGIAGSNISENAVLEITNLTLSDVEISLGDYGSSIGALIGYTPSTADFQDKEKYNNGSAKAIENIAVKGVSVSGEVTGHYTVGGVAGKLYNSGNVDFEDCTNNAKVSAVGKGKGKAGGIIGYIGGKERLQENGSYKSMTITLKNLKNTGVVYASADKVGGILSYMNTFCGQDNTTENLPETHVLIENCVNTGSVTGGKDCQGVGGILYSIQGYKTGYYTTSTNSTIKIVGCSNTGTLSNGKDQKNTVIVPDKTEMKNVKIEIM